MNLLGHDIAVWAAILGGTAVKILTSPYQGLLRAVATVIAAFFAPLVFTEPTVIWIFTQYGADPETSRIPVAVLWTLTGEGLMRLLILVSKDPKKGFELWRAWRSTK